MVSNNSYNAEAIDIHEYNFDSVDAIAGRASDRNPLVSIVPNAGVNDPALMPVIPLQKGRPLSWERKAGRAGGRGWVPELAIDLYRKRRCLAEANCIEAGPGFASRLAASIKDYARGAVEFKGAPFMTAASDDVTAAMVKRACRDDQRVYRFWLNPYDGGKFVTRSFVRSYMADVERAMGCRLAWFAAIHLKATVAFDEHRHFHVIIRGTTMRGETLKIRDAFSPSGFAAIGERLATDMLGPMSDTEIERMEAVAAENAERSHMLNLMKRAGFKGWELQRFEGKAR